MVHNVHTSVVPSFIDTSIPHDLLSSKTKPSPFDTLLASVKTSETPKPENLLLQAISGNLVDYIMAALESSNGARSADDAASAVFGFTASFTATFGDTGPLIDYINYITVRLNLTEGQNRAIQDICVRHKDITKTPANVAKIAAELERAGIPNTVPL